MHARNNPARNLRLALVTVMSFLTINSAPATEKNLQPFDHFGGYPGGAFVKGEYAYLIQARTLTVLQIIGDEFKRINYLALPEEPREVIIDDDTAYLFTAGSDSGVQIIDVSNPISPQWIATAPIKFSYSARFFVENSFVFISDNGKLSIYDAADPGNLVLKSETNKKVRDVYVHNNLVYAACSDGLWVFDISDPTSPRQLSYLATPGVDDVWLQDQQALLLGLRQNAPYIDLTIVNVADSTKPAQSGQIYMDSGFYSNKGFITASPGMAYIGVGTKLYLVDINSPATPMQKGIYSHVGGSFNSLQSVHPSIYAAMGTTDYGFVRIDVSNPTNPVQSAVVFEPWDVTHLFGVGTALYVASSDHLMIWDWSDPQSPLLVGADSRWPHRTRLFVHGSLLYAIFGDSLHIIDVTNPAQMQLKNAFVCASNERTKCIIAGSSYAWLTTYNQTTKNSTLHIIDVRAPQALQVTGVCSFPGEARDLALSGDSLLAAVAYSVSDTDQGLRLIDLSNPVAPVLLGSGNSKGKPTCVWIADTLAFVGSNIGVTPEGPFYIEAFNLSNPAAVTQFGETTGAGIIADLEVSDGTIYASIHGGSVYGYEYFLKNFLISISLIYKCPSPNSIFLALLHFYEMLLGFTCDGAFMANYMLVSASEGIYVQYQQIVNEVEKIFISPPTATLSPGQTQEFTAEGKDKYGNTVPIENPQWSNTGSGEITAQGSRATYTAKGLGKDSVYCEEKDKNILTYATVDIIWTGIQSKNSMPLDFSLSQNFPNPFIPSTRIEYSVREKCHVLLEVFDLLGRKVTTLVDETQYTGTYKVPFSALGAASSIYFYRIHMKDFVGIKKMVLLE